MNQDAIGNETFRAVAAEAEAKASIQQLQSTLVATQNSLVQTQSTMVQYQITTVQTQSSLVQTQNSLVQTQSTMVQTQIVNANLQVENLKMRAIVSCLNRGMFADLNGTCFSAPSQSGSSSDNVTSVTVCTNGSSITPAPCRPGYAVVSHAVTQSCGDSKSSPVTFSCTGEFNIIVYLIVVHLKLRKVSFESLIKCLPRYSG